MSEEEIVSKADAVVIGQVMDQRSFWNTRGNLILTESTLSVNETLVGTMPATIKVTTAGGQVGETIIQAVGFPSFQSQERYLLFLHRVGEELRVLGYRQGQFHIVQDETGRLLARPGLGALFVTPDGRPAVTPVDADLELVKDRIREVARRLGRN